MSSFLTVPLTVPSPDVEVEDGVVCARHRKAFRSSMATKSEI